MTARVIDGKALAAGIRTKIAAHVTRLREGIGLVPGLAVVLVGEDLASRVYVRNKAIQTKEAGKVGFEHRLPGETSEARLLDLIVTLNADTAVHGILVQLPLPGHIDAGKVINTIDPAKDVDGFHISNVGLLATGQRAMVPCIPLSCLMMLRAERSSLAGLEAVVVGLIRNASRIKLPRGEAPK